MPLKADPKTLGPILLRDMPTRLVLDFKAACYARGTSVTDWFRNMMINYVQKNFKKRPLDPAPFISFATVSNKLKGTDMFIRNIPKELRTQFKETATRMGTYMTQVIYKAMLDYTIRTKGGQIDYSAYAAKERKSRRVAGYNPLKGKRRKPGSKPQPTRKAAGV